MNDFRNMTKTNGPHEKEKSSLNLSEMDQNFLRAARAGNLAKVVELLNAGVNINLCNPIGLTALHLASKEGFVDVVAELIHRGADFDAPTKKGNTALHIASLAGHFQVVQQLLDAGANVNRQSVIGFTPLYMAAQENHIDVVDLLLKRGANQALTTEDGFTPLAVALQQGHDRVVALLLERDSRSRGGMPALHIAARKDDVNAAGLLLNNPEVNVNHQAQHGFTPLHIAAHYGNVNVARPLLEHNADVNFQAKNNITPLHIAAKWGRTEMVRLLLSAGALVDCRTRDGLTPLHCAARSGHAELASLLIDASANPSAKTRNGLTPLHMGAQGNNEDVVHVLIMRGASVEDKTGDLLTPLHVAAHCGNREVARILLDNRCDVNARALNGFTPLHIACKKQKIRVVELLLQYGAQIDMITESGLSPLHVAAFIGSPEIVQLLLQNGAYVDQATMRLETALHLAARNRQVEVARALIHHGATVDAKAKDEQTPLHMAVLTGHVDLIMLLLSAGANPNLVTRDAYSTMHIAAKEGHHEVIQILLEARTNSSARTKKGFTPLHLAAKRGRVKAAQQLIFAQPKDVHSTGQNNLTPLHVATHYNHLRVVSLLLDNGAEVDCRQGLTPAHIARRQHFVTIFDILKTVTTTVVSWEEEQEELDGTLELEQPDYMREHPLSESDDDAVSSPATSRKIPQAKPPADASLLSDQRSRTDTLAIGADSVGENDDIWGQLEYMRSTLSEETTSELASPQPTSIVESSPPIRREEVRMYGDAVQSSDDWELDVENVNIVRKPVAAGFLVSFIVDARGGMIQAQRRPDLRFLIPPNVINGPTRIVCRLLHPERVVAPPPINDGDGFACRILELGPVGTRFISPIVLEIPHYAFLTEKNREVIVLRSDNGEVWKEHPLDATDQAVHDTVDGYFDKVSSSDELRKRSVHRILTYDLPQYFALITRVHQELILIGPEGGTLTSNVVPEVQVEFPPGALQKKIRVGLQVHSIEQTLVTRLLGARVSVSPIVTIEPRRRKFHKPITLRMPLPKSTVVSGGPPGHSVIDSPSLRLLCSISGGTSSTIWEDITGSSPLSANKSIVSFTTTVSARLWLVDCPSTTEVVELASRVYHESLSVPYIGRFAVFGRRHHPEEAQLRCLCLTDDPVNKTLETQEGFQLLAVGPPAEVLDDHPYWIETAGNLVPVAKSEEQLQLCVQAFHENRLNMLVRVKDPSQAAVGKLAFMRHPRAVLNALGMPQTRVTVLEARLPDGLGPNYTGPVLKSTDIDDLPVEVERKPLERTEKMVDGYVVLPGKDEFDDTIARSELDLRQVANCLGSDWPTLATHLGLTPEEQHMIRQSYRTSSECAYASLILWQDHEGNRPTTGTKLAHALQQIGRGDVLESCMLNVTQVTSPEECQFALHTIEATARNGSGPTMSGPFSETSGLGTSVDGTVSPSNVPHALPHRLPVDTDEMGVITPVHVEHHKPLNGTVGEQEFKIMPKPSITSPERIDMLQEVKDSLVEHGLSRSESQHSPDEYPVMEDMIVPEVIKRDVPLSSESSPMLGTSTRDRDTDEYGTDDFLPPLSFLLLSEDSCGGVDVYVCKTHPLDPDECRIEPIRCQPCGLNEATWGPSPFVGSEPLEPTVEVTSVQPVGLRETTWGKQADPVSHDTGSEDFIFLDGSAQTSPSGRGPFEDGSDVRLSEAVIRHGSESDTGDIFDETYEPPLGDSLANRFFIPPPTSLTPIPEVSEYSRISSSRASFNPATSMDSGDFSPTGSLESRALVSRRLLHQLLQQMKPPSEPASSSEQDTPSSNQPVESDQPGHRLSSGSFPSDVSGQDHGTASLPPRTSSSHSSLADFLRLETSCEGSRGDISEEEWQLLIGQNEGSLRDLVAGLQALQRQHLDESAGLVTSARSSSGSHLTAGSSEAERQLGALNREMSRACEDMPSVSLVASVMSAQMQQLIQSVSASSNSSVSSHLPSSASTGSSGPSANNSEKPSH
ncbi:ankyrin [Paragonimus westermani]|uniref:Ankyrin n=1 Tax=Paragonimus westermani TaxID=34504 RepID=A0A5J4NST2_9TREM|nr:ankyrin [Paragonimus westermani]